MRAQTLNFNHIAYGHSIFRHSAEEIRAKERLFTVLGLQLKPKRTSSTAIGQDNFSVAQANDQSTVNELIANLLDSEKLASLAANSILDGSWNQRHDVLL